MLEALCRQSSTTLDIVHAEDGPPITQRTSGLDNTATPEKSKESIKKQSEESIKVCLIRSETSDTCLSSNGHSESIPPVIRR
jgi:hypothetical protein